MLTPAAQKSRSKGIGSSEIAMLIYLPDENGDMKPLSPWGGKHKLWRRKTGKDGEQDTKAYMTRGQYMETGLINWYADEVGVDWKKPRTKRSKKYPYVVDSCDGLTYPKGSKGKDPLRCIEAKTSSYWKRDEWGDAGTDEVPSYYLVQCQWHLGVHSPEEMICDVPMDNGTKRTDYHVHFDEELWLSLVNEAERFWVDYVEADVEPPIDDYQDTCKWLDRYLKNRDGLGTLEAGEEQVKLMLQYRNIALQLKEGEGALFEIREKLQRDIGEYDGLIVPETKLKILWKQSKDTTGVDWKTVCDKLAHQLIENGTLSRVDLEVMKAEHTGVTRKGARKWTPTTLIKGNLPEGMEDSDGTAQAEG